MVVGVLWQDIIFLNLLANDREVLLKRSYRISLMPFKIQAVEISWIQLILMPVNKPWTPVPSRSSSPKLSCNFCYNCWCRWKASITKLSDVLKKFSLLLIIEEPWVFNSLVSTSSDALPSSMEGWCDKAMLPGYRCYTRRSRRIQICNCFVPVSYTHLTLPTKRIV